MTFLPDECCADWAMTSGAFGAVSTASACANRRRHARLERPWASDSDGKSGEDIAGSWGLRANPTRCLEPGSVACQVLGQANSTVAPAGPENGPRPPTPPGDHGGEGLELCSLAGGVASTRAVALRRSGHRDGENQGAGSGWRTDVAVS